MGWRRTALSTLGRSGHAARSRLVTRFRRMAEQRGYGREGMELIELSGNDSNAAAYHLTSVPAWLHERIARAWEARSMIGEDVSRQENARDQLVAFRSWFGNQVGEPRPAWTRLSDSLAQPGEAILRIEAVIRSLGLPKISSS